LDGRPEGLHYVPLVSVVDRQRYTVTDVGGRTDWTAEESA